MLHGARYGRRKSRTNPLNWRHLYNPFKPSWGEPYRDIVARFHSPRTAPIEVAPGQYNGAVWAVSLWNERGLAGVLLLGQKEDGGVYTQEEMDIARASCERLLDIRASAEVARRLLALQRQRLVESQIADRRTRRILHDDVLPQIHAALLALGSDHTAMARGADGPRPTTRVESDARSLLADAHRLISDLLRDTPPAVSPEVTRLGPLGALQRALANEFAGSVDAVTWDAPQQVMESSRTLPPPAGEVLFYAAREALRNAVRHGMGAGGRIDSIAEPFHVKIHASNDQGHFVVEIVDNGVGIPSESVQEPKGRGLALHSTMMAVVGGTLELDSVPGRYTRVRLVLPYPQNME